MSIDTRDQGAAMSEEERSQLQRERIERAAREAGDYEITYHPAIGKWLVTNPVSTKSYMVRDADGVCDCPDSQFTCSPLQLRCKHSIAVALHRLFHGKDGAR